MKNIKDSLNNEYRNKTLLKENNNNQLKTSQNNYIITEYNSSNNHSKRLNKFEKTTINFNNIINSEFKSRYFPSTSKKNDDNQKILKLRTSNKNKSNLNTKIKRDMLLPNLKAQSIYFQKKNPLSLNHRQNKINVNNFIKSFTSKKDNSRKFLNIKFNQTMFNNFNGIKNKEIKIENKEDNNLYNNEKSIKDEHKYKYSLILKNLDVWDKEHCEENQKNSGNDLFNYLFNYYQKNNLIEEQKNLIFASNILKARTNYYNLVEKGKQNDKIFMDILKRKKRETGTILNNTLYKAKLKFSELFNKKYSKEFNENLDIDADTLNLLIEDEIKNVFYNQVIKERIKYENQLHDEILKVNNIIFDRKNMKDEKASKLKELFLEKNKLIKEYNEKYTKNRKAYWFKYDNYEHHYKRLITKTNIKTKMNLNNEDEDKNVNENEVDVNDDNTLKDFKFGRTKSIMIDEEKKFSKSPSPLKKRRRLSLVDRKAMKDLKKQIKDIEDEKNFKILHMNNEMNSKLKIIHNNYKNKIEKINENKKKLENEVKIIKNEIIYYKKINDELIREHKLYYMEKLKKGYDCRKDGLIWIVVNLLELQIPLEYHHFPKYLTHEQIDYIKKYAKLQLKQNVLKIIINVLKKKQNTQKMNDVLKCMDAIDNMIETDNNDNMDDFVDSNNNFNNKYNNRDFIIARNKINKKFVKLYQDNIEVMKNYLNKNIENYEFHQVINELKKELYHGSNSTNKKSKRDILNVFMGDNNNKNFFQFLMDIKSNFQYLEDEKDKIFETQKQNYFKLIKNTPTTKVSIIDAIKNEMIKRCLFGTKLDN